MKLSLAIPIPMPPFERQNLAKTLSSLPTAQFEHVVFALKVPGGIVPSSTAPQGDRAAALLGWVETTGPGLNKLQAVLAQVLEKELPDLPGICPYKGLSYFDCNDEDYKYFYGREALTQTLLDRVAQAHFLAIVGASGSGKSSVLRAGLLQRLKDEGSYEIHLLVPGEHPLQNLALAFVDPNLERLDRASQQQKAKQLIQTGAEGLCALVETAEAQTVVLVVDQFEEAFTLCQNMAERQAFFDTLLGGLAGAGARLWLIVAMRSDFVGKCFEQDYGGLAKLVQSHLESVLPMTKDEVTQAIAEPARQAGVALEPGLKDAMLNDLQQSPGGLPLLQYTLTELWHRQQDNQLKLSIYHQLGGITGTLKQRADEVYDALTPEQQQTAKHIFMSLTQLGEGAEDTRRRITQASLISAQHPNSQVAEVVKRLADANLVVTDDRSGAAEGIYSATVDVAHEALIRNWPKLRQWLEENRDLLRQQRKIELAAEEWSRQPKKQQQGYLLQGRQLSDARTFHKRHTQDFPLSNQAEVLISRSLRRRWVNCLKLSSFLILPLTLTYFIIEPTIRRGRTQEAIIQIRQKGPGTREAVEYMARGCPMHRKLRGIPNPEAIVSIIFRDCISFFGYDLSSTDLNDAKLNAAEFSNAELSGTNFSNTHLRNASLIGADLRDASLGNTDLRGADLSHAFLRNAFLQIADLRDAVLQDARFLEANLRDADLRDADLRDAILIFVDLRNADLRNANLNSSVFLATDLRWTSQSRSLLMFSSAGSGAL
ncbi:MAG: pentapeptide repeat-containing protein, partial [Cyanobacteria bacterium J06638_6]